MIVDVRERTFAAAPPGRLGEMIDHLGQADDRLWPSATGRWAPMRLDGPLDRFPSGGHGMVRYRTIGYVPGQRVVFRFDPALGLDGTHRFEVIDDVTLRHTLRARARGAMRLAWPLVVRPLHAATLADLFDCASAELGRPLPPRRHSRWVRVLLVLGPSPAAETERAERRAARSGSTNG